MSRVFPNAPPGVRLARLTLLTWMLGALGVASLAVAGVLAGSRVDRDAVAVILPFDVSWRLPIWGALVGSGCVAAATVVALVTDELRAAIQVLTRRDHPAATHDPVTLRARHLLEDWGTPAHERRRLPTALGRIPMSRLPARQADGVRSPVRVTVLVPAHNEEALISDALASLASQTRLPDRVIVVADNCTDATVSLARAARVEVLPTVGNTERKAGALNQALAQLLPDLGDDDVVMVMDADTLLSSAFIAAATARLEADPDLIAVGGIFHGEPGAGLVGALQRNEYTRYARHIGRKHGKVFVLTGTASLIRGYALTAVAESRGSLIPGHPGRVYDTFALTEDNELTLALRTLGAKMVSPPECTNVTEIMETWPALWRQRSRWQRGALENIGTYGPTRPTALYWAQQVGIGWGAVALNTFLLMMTITVVAADHLVFTTFWVAVGWVFVVERVVTVWAAGWRGRLLALPIFIELAYDVFLQAVFAKSLIDIASGRSADWNSVTRDGSPPSESDSESDEVTAEHAWRPSRPGRGTVAR